MSAFSPPPFSAPYAPDDRTIAARLLEAARLDAGREQRIGDTATRLIEAIRANDDPLGGVEDMLREFALSTKEGLALMVLAEALLRVPDAHTADRFIEDRLGQGDFVNRPMVPCGVSPGTITRADIPSAQAEALTRNALDLVSWWTKSPWPSLSSMN